MKSRWGARDVNVREPLGIVLASRAISIECRGIIMKLTQTVLLVAVLVVLIGGVTFVRNWLRTPDRRPGAQPKPLLDVIDVPFPISSEYPEQEFQSQGYHDFYFQNQSMEGAEVGVETKSCKCAKVEVLTLTPDEQHEFQTMIQQWAGHKGKAPWGLYPDVAGLQVLVQRVRQLLAHPQDGRWMLLASAEKEHQVVTLPPKSTGFFRLTWQNKNPGAVAHGSKIWQQVPGDPQTRNPDRIDLRVPLMVVKPVRLYPEHVKDLELGPNQTYSFEALCWSSTRPTFKLTSVKEENGDPCFVATVTPLTGDALQQATETLQKNATAKESPTWHVRCAYRVSVSIHERQPGNGKQLDLGPFQKKLQLTTDQDDFPTLELPVQGMVRGDVTVGTETERDMIILKTFPVRKGREVTVPVESSQPDMKLTIDSKKPDYLRVQLVERKDLSSPGRKRWDLTVAVPPNSRLGRLEDAYVKLKTDSERYIRIPVRGNATIELRSP
jgi:hypothetical protein